MREVNEVLGTLDFEDWDNESAKKGLAVEKVKNWLLPRHIKVKSEPLTENAPRLSQVHFIIIIHKHLGVCMIIIKNYTVV